MSWQWDSRRKNGLPVLQRKQKGKENLSKPCEQLFCCMMKKWHSIRSVSYYRDWSSREMSAELEKVFKGLDICGGYCLCVKSGKFLKHVQSNVPDGKSIKGLFPKMVYIIPMQMDIVGVLDCNYNKNSSTSFYVDPSNISQSL
ncbi:uncharacterized protein LOC123473704 isoform X2 [Daphnia magna]|uniref:uncharacterized protein LOC123473704 isoform X2 n=1 Tax=Daphnia magna TaxID=35525 RepID=UPI001E1BD308|nr:uncharacterized protein LOC123473704 isoform X2 [Daphnia magna]